MDRPDDEPMQGLSRRPIGVPAHVARHREHVLLALGHRVCHRARHELLERRGDYAHVLRMLHVARQPEGAALAPPLGGGPCA